MRSLARFAVGGDAVENRSSRILEEFQHQVQSIFLYAAISYSDRRALANAVPNTRPLTLENTNRCGS